MNPKTFIATTGHGVARATPLNDEWTVELLLADQDVRCLAADPRNPNTVYAGTQSNGVLRSTDGGQTWQLASTGLTVPWRHHMVERFTQLDTELLAVLSNGAVLIAPLAALEWQRIVPGVKGVAAVTWLPD